MGIEPFPAEEFKVSHHAEEILSDFSEEKNNFQNVMIAGRLMQKRIMGKASFAEIQDSTGRIQVYLNRDELCPDEDKSVYNDLFKKYMDIGDFVGFHGKVFKTQTGHTSLHASNMTFYLNLSSLCPLSKQMQKATYMMLSQISKCGTGSAM